MAAAHVKSASAVFSGTGSAVATFASPVTAGNLLIVFCGVNSTSAVFTPSDSAVNTYVAMDTTTGQNSRSKGFYVKNCLAGAGNLAVTMSLAPGTGYGSVIVHEVSGCDTTDPLNVKTHQAQTNVATTANAITSTAVLTTSDGQYIFSGTTQDNVESIAVAQGTDVAYILGVATNNSGQVSETEYLIQTSAASIAGTWTAGTTGKHWCTQIATFKVAGGGASLAIPIVAYHRNFNLGA